MNENQGVYQVAIRRADMAEDDPPVYVVETDDDGTVNEIGQAENSLSAFMMGMLIYEAAISCFEFCAEDIIWYDDGDVEKIVMQGDSPNGTYSARTETAYQEIDRLIGGIGER